MTSPSIEATVEVVVATTLTQLSERGYSAHFVIESDGAVCCPVCGVCAAPEHVSVEERWRAQDEHDEALVLAVRCDVCRTQGAAVAWGGATASAGDGTLLAVFSEQPARD